jgi:bacteriocin biosynthesis cyclodehydratase domain-containing protein
VDREEPQTPEHPTLSRLYEVIPLDADRIQVGNASRSVVLRGPGLADRVMPLFGALDGASTRAELTSHFPGLAPQLLRSLTEKGMLVDGGASLSQSGPMALTAAGLGGLSPSAVGESLGDATVAFVGCGPVAAMAAMQLAKAEIGRLLLSDDGALTSSEVAVSPLLEPSARGGSRSQAVVDLCRKASPTVAEACAPEVARTAASSGLTVIEGRDDSGIPLSSEADAALAAGQPFLVHSQDGLEAFVGPYVPPGGHPCHRCAETRRLGHVEHLDEFLAFRRARADRDSLPDAFLAAHVSFVSGLLAVEVLRILTGAPHLTDGGVAVVDLEALEVRREGLLPVPQCGGCVSAPADESDPDYKPSMHRSNDP